MIITYKQSFFWEHKWRKKLETTYNNSSTIQDFGNSLRPAIICKFSQHLNDSQQERVATTTNNAKKKQQHAYSTILYQQSSYPERTKQQVISGVSSFIKQKDKTILLWQ